MSDDSDDVQSPPERSPGLNRRVGEFECAEELDSSVGSPLDQPANVPTVIDSDVDELLQCATCAPEEETGRFGLPATPLSAGPKGSDPDRNRSNAMICEKEMLEVLAVNAWHAESVRSPEAGRVFSVMDLAERQSGKMVDLSSPDCTDDLVRQEAEIVAAIGGRQEEEEEEETDESTAWKPETGDAIKEEDELMEISCLNEEEEKVIGSPFGQPNFGTPGMVTSKPTASADKLMSAPASQLPTSGTETERRMEHWRMASYFAFTGFECSCPIAKNRGAKSCIDRFSREQFRSWHTQTYGKSLSGEDEEAKSASVAEAIHQKMYGLATPIKLKNGDEQDRHGW